MSWTTYKLGDVLQESKVESVKPDTNRRIKVRLNAKGVEKRPDTKEKKGATKQYIRKAGQFIYGKQNLHKGAFGVIPPELDGFESSSDIPSFDISNKCLPEWIDFYFKAGNFYLSLTKYARGIATKRISPKDFYGIEIPLPNIETQKRIIEKFQSTGKTYGQISSEISHQQTLLSQLKQAILQDAISGKLTKQWRTLRQAQGDPIELASELLKRIKTEKEKLVREGKIKKEKPLPPIKPEDVPFELPEGWVWCRLGEICNYITSGSTPSRDSFASSDIPYLKVYNIRNQQISFKFKPQFIKSTVHKGQLRRSKLMPGEVIMNIVGPPLGKVAIIPDTYEEWNCNQAIAIFRGILESTNSYIYIFLGSGIFLSEMDFKGMAGQDNISITMCRKMLFPLPPLIEQEVIIKIEKGLKVVLNELEAQITQSQKDAGLLMQAVLKEAFEG